MPVRCSWPAQAGRRCWVVFLLLATTLAAHGATNSFLWKTNFYTVTGTNLAELHVSLGKARPWNNGTEFVGLTDWRIHWRYETAPGPGGCRCVSFTTQTTITTTLPRWSPPPGVSTDVKREWDRFVTALGEHEQGHGRLALAALADLHRKVQALGTDTDCALLGRRIDLTANRVLEEHRQRDADYDRRTRHGANQGAAFPGGRPPPR